MPDKNEVSIDEVMEKRKEFTNDDGILFKAMSSPKSWDPETRSANFIMSAETEDRHRDVVVQAGINLEQFSKNPIAFFNHRSHETPIGQWDGIKQVAGRPKRTEGRMVFCDEGVDEMADRVARHVETGTLRAASIGFRPLKMSRIEDDEGNWTYGYKFDEIELYECSVVTVPAVREALVKGAGDISEVMSPEVVEEFLEHLKSNPAVAQMVDKQLFESAYREATGNKSSVETLTMSLDATGFAAEFKDALEPTILRMEKAAGIEPEVEDDPVVEDPVIKEMETAVSDLVEKVSPQIEEIEDEERKGGIASIIDGLKSLFKSEPEAPKLASEEDKKALQQKIKEMEIEEIAA